MHAFFSYLFSLFKGRKVSASRPSATVLRSILRGVYTEDLSHICPTRWFFAKVPFITSWHLNYNFNDCGYWPKLSQLAYLYGSIINSPTHHRPHLKISGAIQEKVSWNQAKTCWKLKDVTTAPAAYEWRSPVLKALGYLIALILMCRLRMLIKLTDSKQRIL